MATIKQIILPWDEVPEMAPSIKRAVELSIWSMFEVATELECVKYLLDTTESRFLLKPNGSINKIVETTDVFEIRERVFFEGLVVSAEQLKFPQKL